MSEGVTLLDSGKLKIELDTDGKNGVPTFHLSGVIDEDVNFSIVLSAIQDFDAGGVVRFDLGQVTRMNSCGVREWILLMERVVPVKCEFVNMNPLFVEQLNVIPNMMGSRGSKIISFQAPYHCPKCDADSLHLLRAEDVTFTEGEPKAPERQCETCGTALEFGWLEDEYFSFLQRK